MKGLIRILLLLLVVSFSYSWVRGQEALMDAVTKNRLDSLDQRIKYLELEIPILAETLAPSYFFVKRELDYTIFQSYYYRYIFDEELDQARTLIESRLKGAQKRGDTDAVAFYSGYSNKLTKEIANQQRRYNYLFAKEKNFRSEFDRFIEAADEYSLNRAKRMTDLAIKFASEKNLPTVLEYLYRYQNYVAACLFDFSSEYDLVKLTHSEASFQKAFTLLIESDSLELIQEAGKLTDQCYNYVANIHSALDTNYFAMQRKVVNTSISDYNERKGYNSNLTKLGGQSVIARVDSLNKEGIYKWHDKILVVGHFKPTASIDNVKKGEAIIDADRKLFEYIRVNRLAKLKDDARLGQTYFIPYQEDDKIKDFCYNPNLKQYQYMICYTMIESSSLTKEINKFLPPLQFKTETGEQ